MNETTDAMVKPIIASMYVPWKNTTGTHMQSKCVKRVTNVYKAIALVLLYVARMPSNPMVGSIRNGTGEKIRRALVSSGFFKLEAINGEPINRVNEKTPPNMKNNILILSITSLASLFSTLGKKNEYAFGSPRVKTERRV